jgi:hypothetical protein
MTAAAEFKVMKTVFMRKNIYIYAIIYKKFIWVI